LQELANFANTTCSKHAITGSKHITDYASDYDTRECVTKRKKSNTRASSCPPRYIVPTNFSPRLGITYSSPFENTSDEILSSRDSKINPGFAGRIQLFLKNWEAITSNKWVLETVEKGYQILFTSTPIQHKIPQTPQFSATEAQLLQEKLENLLQKQAIQEHPNPVHEGFYSNMFIVPKKDSGQRPVINLKHLNHFVKAEHFKTEGLHTAKSLLQQGDWLAKVDLKDAFFMIPIAEHQQHLLMFNVRATKNLSVRLSTIWPLLSPLSIHKDTETSNRIAERTGNSPGNIHGRYVAVGKLPICVHRVHLHNHVHFREPGLCHKQAQISTSTNTIFGVSRDDNKLNNHGVISPLQEDQGNTSRDSKIAEQPYMHSKAAIPLDRQAKRNLPSTANSPSVQWHSKVSSRARTPHKLLGASCCNLGSKDLCQGQGKHVDPAEDGQYFNNCIHQQKWGQCHPH